MIEFATLALQDLTTAGTFTPKQLDDFAWSLRYQLLYQYNRSPWVEKGYAFAAEDVVLITNVSYPWHVKTATAPTSTNWVLELLDTSDQAGALGYHEDKTVTSSAHSTRGLAAGTQVPLAKIFVKTSNEAGIAPSEVASHEALEALVDPWVVNENEIRKYLNPATKQWYIGEVGDEAQGRGYDVGAPEKRPIGVKEAIVADFGYPGWWGQPQTRTFTTAAEEFGLAPRLEPFVLSPGGYMSVAPEANPTEWTQIYGSDRPKAEANAKAYERPGEAG